MKQLPLRRVLNLSVVLGLAAAAAILLLSFRDLSDRIDSQFRREAEERTQLVARLMLNALLLSDYQEVQSTAENLFQHRQMVGVRVTNAHGEAIVDLKPHRTYSKTYLTVVPLMNERNGTTMGMLQIEQSYDFFDNLLITRFLGIAFSILALGAGLMIIYFWASRTVVSFFSQVSEQFRHLMKDETATMNTEWRFRELSSLCQKFNDLAGEMLALRRTERDQAKFVALAELASQVAHDIRSPLSALTFFLEEGRSLPDAQKTLLRSSIYRIQDIAEQLLSENRARSSEVDSSNDDLKSSKPNEPCLISAGIEEIVSERRIGFRGRSQVEIRFAPKTISVGLFSNVEPSELKRVISNLINNAVEAVPIRGIVTIELDGSESEAIIRVTDNGKGIPEEVLERLRKGGFSYGKKNGHGLGLRHAFVCAEKWKGMVRIESVEHRGTCVSLTVPKVRPPDWYLSELAIEPTGNIFLLDDDASMKEFWLQRMRNTHEGLPDRLLFFNDLDSFLSFIANQTINKNDLLLFDYELVGPETGIEVLRRSNFGGRAILVTSHYEEERVREEASLLSVKLLPKRVAPYIPIRIKKYPDYVLIDDDPITKLSWELSADKNGIILAVFSSLSEFMVDYSQLPKSTPVYVDFRLDDGERDGLSASSEIFQLGFSKIFLATGEPASNFNQPAWLSGITGKFPPWRPVSR